MSLPSLLQRFRPIFHEDEADWACARASLQSKRSIIWHASSGLDFTPVLELHGGRLYGMHQAPHVIRSRYSSQSLFFFSDYNSSCLRAMKKLYDELDDVEPEELGFRVFHACGPSLRELFGQREPMPFSCAEIIPLQLFSDCETLRERYPSFHSSVTRASVPDDHWHAAYLDVALTFRGHEISCQLIFLHLENLLCFEEVFQASAVPIDIFYAKRVGGKSQCFPRIYGKLEST